MNPDVVKSQAVTLREWAEHWSRDDTPGASEIAFLLARASRFMLGDQSTPEAMGYPRVAAIEAGLPEPETVSEIREE